MFKVHLFAILRERTGLDCWCFQGEPNLRGSRLLAAFFEAYPQLAGLRKVTRLAVNQRFTREDLLLRETDELALIPPVSGG